MNWRTWYERGSWQARVSAERPHGTIGERRGGFESRVEAERWALRKLRALGALPPSSDYGIAEDQLLLLAKETIG